MPKIMIVDDDRTMVKLLKTLLELDGFDVSVVRDGCDVVEKALELMPDVIMMDYHLSDTNGSEVLRHIRAHQDLAHLPVVIASGMNVEDEVLAAGANAFLVKPFDPDDLPKLFSQLMGS